MVKFDLGKVSFKVKKFKQLDGKLRGAITKNNWVGFERILCEQAKLVRDILEDIALETAIVLPQNEQLADDLKKIRAEDESFFYFRLSALAKIPEKNDDAEEFQDIGDNKWNGGVAGSYEEAESKVVELIGRSETYTDEVQLADGSSFPRVFLDPYPFLERKRKVSALILASHPPKAVREHFEAVKDLFILGRFEASVVFCRALLEEAYRHYRKKTGLSRKEDVIDFTNMSFAAMIGETHLRRDIKDLTIETKGYVDDLLHTKSGEFLRTNESKALDIITDTIHVLEYLYK